MYLYAEGEEHEDDHYESGASDRLDVCLQAGAHGVQVDVFVKVPDVPTSVALFARKTREEAQRVEYPTTLFLSVEGMPTPRTRHPCTLASKVCDVFDCCTPNIRTLPKKGSFARRIRVRVPLFESLAIYRMH